MDFRDYWRIVRRQWIWSLSIFVMMMLVFLSYSFLVEKQLYRATCQIGIRAPLVDEQIFRETSSLVPPVTYNMKTKVELMDRRNLLDDATQRLLQGIEVEERLLGLAGAGRPNAAPAAAPVALPFQEAVAEVARAHGVPSLSVEGREVFLVSRFRAVEDPEKRGRALAALADRLADEIPNPETEIRERTQLVMLSVIYPGEREAVMLANALGFAAMDRDVSQTKATREAEADAIRQHIDQTMQRIRQIKSDIETFQQRHEIRQLDEDLTDARKTLRSLEEQLRVKRNERLRIEHEIQNPPPTMFSAGTPLDTPRLLDLRAQLVQEEQRMTVLLLDLTENHPDVRRGAAQIERLKRDIEEETRREEARREERHVEAVNALYDRLRLVADEIAETERQIEDAKVKLRTLADLRFEHDDLYRALNFASEQRDRLKLRLDAIELLKTSATPETGTIRVETAADAAHPLRKQSRNALGIMVIMAVVVSVGIAYLVEYADTRIRTEEDIRKHLNMPVLAKVEKRGRGEKVCLVDLPPRDAFAEIFNTVSTVITSAARDLGIKVFVVSSTVAEEGKTTITVNLGVAMARKGLRVILVDGDLRRPQLHDILGVDNTGGLSTVLEGRAQAMESLSEIAEEPAPAPGVEAFLRPTSVDNLLVLTSGPTPHDPISLLESQRMKDLVEELRGMADFILIDTPPIFHVGDVLTLTPLVDANLFVVGAYEVKQHEVTWAKHLLSNVEANILGAFLNKEVIESKSYYYYYRYYKGYRYRN